MQEKDMVNDILSGTKASIDSYTKAIQECSCQELRGTLKQLRDEAEQMQYQLYEIADEKGYYQTASKVDKSEVNKVKSGLTSGLNSSGSSGTSTHTSSSVGTSAAATGLSKSILSSNDSNNMK